MINYKLIKNYYYNSVLECIVVFYRSVSCIIVFCSVSQCIVLYSAPYSYKNTDKENLQIWKQEVELTSVLTLSNISSPFGLDILISLMPFLSGSRSMTASVVMSHADSNSFRLKCFTSLQKQSVFDLSIAQKLAQDFSTDLGIRRVENVTAVCLIKNTSGEVKRPLKESDLFLRRYLT